jgi:hypothetical protein
MSDDLVTRLRKWGHTVCYDADGWDWEFETYPLAEEAAKEIEKLRGEVPSVTLSDEETIEVLREVARTIPGVELRTGLNCRASSPQGPSTPNWHVSECRGMPLNHEGPHSWER